MLGYLLTTALSVAGFVALWGLFWWWRYRLPLDADEVHFVTAADGQRLALHRYRPAPGVRQHQHPAVLCHGLGANRFNVCYPRYSLARFLSERGFDTWVIELRGAGLSWPKDKSWGFDVFVEQDVPAAIRHVREITGKKRVHWAGHSMGGLVIYAHVGSRVHAGDSDIASLTAVASPALFAHHTHLAPLVPFLKVLKLSFGMRQALPALLVAPLLRAWLWPVLRDLPIPRLVCNLDNIDPSVVRRLLANLPTDMPLELLAQFGSWVERHAFDSVDGRHDYFDLLRNVREPSLFLAGNRDLLAPPDAVRAGYERVGSRDKRFMLVAPSDGAHAEYGHGDLLIGRHAAEDVFKHVAAWMEKHDKLALTSEAA